ncbi:MAG TPA: hypothetical protein VN829_23450 [Dongiaceae bacterium]|nr:hypothetical protein [Dongiaceae bacterium]
MSMLRQRKPGPTFDRALATVDALGVDEQEALVDVVRKRIAAARRAALAEQVAASRRDYRRGNVRRGTADDLMAELHRA